jgi:hypothetical protein
MLANMFEIDRPRNARPTEQFAGVTRQVEVVDQAAQIAFEVAW